VANGITVDPAGDAYVTGYTASIDFPVTGGTFQSSLHGLQTSDIFVTKFPLGFAQAFSISGLTPAYGGNVGTVRSHVVSEGFHNAVVVELVGMATIPGSLIDVGSEGRVVLENNNEHLKQLSTEGLLLCCTLLSPRQEVAFGACLWTEPGEPGSAAVSSVRPFAW
jgi:hypothetical protein